MKLITNLVEKSAFGVCSYLGKKMGVASNRVRLYFIYSSFLTFGSPAVLYLAVAFWVNVREYIRKKKNMIWE